VEDRPLASGSFKSVYKATWAAGGSAQPQQVAVLVLRQAQGGGGSMADEIKIFELLGRHPHLVKLLALSNRPPAGDVCMVLEFAQRGSLDCVLQDLAERRDQGGDPPTHAVLLTAAAQVCMWHAHSTHTYMHTCTRAHAVLLTAACHVCDTCTCSAFDRCSPCL
jgi:hypothetical protein